MVSVETDVASIESGVIAAGGSEGRHTHEGVLAAITMPHIVPCGPHDFEWNEESVHYGSFH